VKRFSALFETAVAGSVRCAALVVVAFLVLAARAAEQVEPVPPRASPTLTEENPPVKGEVPKGILDPILNEAAALANIAREQLVIVRAEPVVWNDGSLGCPEPGMMYTQALVNEYWVIVEAAGKKYDFRVDRGNFRLCPPGRGHPPSQPATN
jgi:hypothetical protein